MAVVALIASRKGFPKLSSSHDAGTSYTKSGVVVKIFLPRTEVLVPIEGKE
jgi:hypothetical protein